LSDASELATVKSRPLKTFKTQIITTIIPTLNLLQERCLSHCPEKSAKHWGY